MLIFIFQSKFGPRYEGESGGVLAVFKSQCWAEHKMRRGVFPVYSGEAGPDRQVEGTVRTSGHLDQPLLTTRRNCRQKCVSPPSTEDKAPVSEPALPYHPPPAQLELALPQHQRKSVVSENFELGDSCDLSSSPVLCWE